MLDISGIKRKEVIWHQRCNIKKGDSVYIYVTEPIGAIGYKCKVTEADIPAPTNSKYKRHMKLRLEKKYDTARFNRTFLAEHGVSAVRSARSVPPKLSAALNK